MWKPNKHCLLDSKPVQSIGLHIHSHKNILNNAAKASKNHGKQSERCKTLAGGKQSPRRKIWNKEKKKKHSLRKMEKGGKRKNDTRTNGWQTQRHCRKTPLLKKTMMKKKKQRACSRQKTSNGIVGGFLLVLVAKQTTIWPSRMNALLYGRKVYLDANGGRDGSGGVFCVWCLERERNGRE
jgi:hypothetical protein